MNMGQRLRALKNRLTRKALKRLSDLLPNGLKLALYRRSVRLYHHCPDNIIFKVAETKDELEQAFRLLYAAYLKQGFVQSSSSGMYLTLQHALPSTSTLVAVRNNEVVGTVTVVRDNPLGLSMEKHFSLEPLRLAGARVAEVSSLAIAHSMRRETGGEIFFPLVTFLYRYSTQFHGLDYHVIAIYPHHGDLYRAIFGYEKLQAAPVQDYMGAPAAAFFHDLKAAPVFLAQKYSGNPPERDLHHYALKKEFPHFRFPRRKYATISDPVLTPELLEYFFLKNTDLFACLSLRQWRYLKEQYEAPEYDQVFSQISAQGSCTVRQHRFDVLFPGRILTSRRVAAELNISLRVLDVSKEGFRAVLSRDIALHSQLQIQMAIETFEIVELQATPLWRQGQRIYGFKILGASENWYKFVEYLNDELRIKKAA
ncbi:MAG: hypothetical protein A2070_08465 [Bdellovibrionales bacterium GWC1_52_8]|nr:MAG: hypothetical protein A2Z97_04845 [Bdellovibrionales bacterium GWB1_52_6]OFZ42932.1 MAG: hypothetical protein A2070_08465 [Bdellovibrionales bacterium GWC1_52_8]